VTIRFQADADLDERIVSAVFRIAPQIDFRDANDAGFEGVPDPEVLARCARDRRVLVTHDKSTMPVHFAEFLTHTVSAGVLVARRGAPITEIAEEIAMIALASEADEWRNRIVYIPM